MPEDFVPVAAYATPLEADLAMNYLEAEGIPVLLSDDATVGWFWHLGNAVGGVKLLVPRARRERAAAKVQGPVTVRADPRTERMGGVGPPVRPLGLVSEPVMSPPSPARRPPRPSGGCPG